MGSRALTFAPCEINYLDILVFAAHRSHTKCKSPLVTFYICTVGNQLFQLFLSPAVAILTKSSTAYAKFILKATNTQKTKTSHECLSIFSHLITHRINGA